MSRHFNPTVWRMGDQIDEFIIIGIDKQKPWESVVNYLGRVIALFKPRGMTVKYDSHFMYRLFLGGLREEILHSMLLLGPLYNFNNAIKRALIMERHFETKSAMNEGNGYMYAAVLDECDTDDEGEIRDVVDGPGMSWIGFDEYMNSGVSEAEDDGACTDNGMGEAEGKDKSVDVGKARNVGVSQAKGTGVCETDITGVGKTKVVNGTKVTDLGETEGAGLEKAEGTDVGETEGVDVGEAESANVGKAEGAGVGKTKGTDVGKAGDLDVGDAEGEGVGGAETKDVSQAKETDVGETDITGVGKVNDAGAGVTKATDLGETETEGVEKPEIISVGDTKVGGVGDAEVTDVGEAVGAGIGIAEGTDFGETEGAGVDQTVVTDVADTEDEGVGDLVGEEDEDDFGLEDEAVGGVPADICNLDYRPRGNAPFIIQAGEEFFGAPNRLVDLLFNAHHVLILYR